MHIINPQLVIISNNPPFQIPYTSIIYADISPDARSVLLAVNADAILVSITNLLTTQKGERLNLPEYGADISDFLFDIMDDETKNNILLRVYNEIIAWEPRVRMIFGRCSLEEDTEEHRYVIKLVFSLIGLEDILVEYSGILTRTKSIVSSMYN